MNKNARTKNDLEKINQLQKTDVILGIDFGTSSSRVAIGTPSFPVTSTIVNFENYSHEFCKYLLPTIIYESGNSFYIGKLLDKNDKTYSELKMKLKKYASENKYNFNPNLEGFVEIVYPVIAYLSFLIVFTKDWAYKNKQDVLKKYNPEWFINIGCPVGFINNKEFGQFYKQITEVAWLISSKDNFNTNIMLSKDIISSYIDKYLTNSTKQNIVEVFPEVVAEIHSYIKSPYRNDESGLHLLIDIGSGTMDICIFILHKDEDQSSIVSILLANVLEMGVSVLHNNRLSELLKQAGNMASSDRMKNLEKQLHNMKKIITNDKIRPFEVEQYINNELLENEKQNYNNYIMMEDIIKPFSLLEYIKNVFKKTIYDIDNAYDKKSRNRIESMMIETEKYRAALHYKNQNFMTLFMCGGGSKIELARVIKDKLKQTYNKKFQIIDSELSICLKDNIEIDDTCAVDKDRFSIAYGLSDNPQNIARCNFPEDIEDAPLENKTSNSYYDDLFEKWHSEYGYLDD